MSDPVSWKGLYRTSKSGASFKRVLIKPDTVMPYAVGPFERVVIPKTDQKIVIDLSNIKADDDAFQIYDSGRNFDKNSVLIKASTDLVIADADKDTDGTNRDLLLDMVGAGQVWEFVRSDGILIASDSPGFTGGVAGGGSAPAPAPATSGGSGGTIILTGNGSPQKALTYPLAVLGGPQSVLYIDQSKIMPDDMPNNILRTYLWPANTPDDGTHNKWQATQLGTLQQMIWETDEIDNDHKLFFTGEGDPKSKRIADLIEKPSPDKTHKGYVYAVYLDTKGTGFWANVRLSDSDGTDVGEKTDWINIGGSGSASSGTDAVIYYRQQDPQFDGFSPPEGGSGRDVIVFCPASKDSAAWIWPANRPKQPPANTGSVTWPWEWWDILDDADLKREYGPQLTIRTPFFVGTEDPTVATTIEVGGELDSLYLNTATGQWFMWPKQHMIPFDIKDGKPVQKPDAKSLWTPISGSVPTFNQRDFSASSQPTLPTITAAPGDLIVINFNDNDRNVPDASITFPTPKVGDKPIRVLFSGGLATVPENNQTTIMARDAEIVITSPVPIIGVWDDFESGDKTLNLDMAGEMAEFSPFTYNNQPAWLITSANYVSEDSHMKVITADYNAAMGDTLIVFASCLIHLPRIDDEKDLDPITVISNQRDDIVGQNTGPVRLQGLSYQSGALDVFQGKYKGQKLAINPSMGAPTELLVDDGDWITITPYKAPTAGSFWLITGCNPS